MTRSPATAAAAPLARPSRGPRHREVATNTLTSTAVVQRVPGGGPRSPAPVVAPAAAPLPLPSLVAVAPRSPVHYVVSATDDRGRQGDTSSVGVLGWQPGLSVAYLLLPAGVGVVVVRGGPATLTGLGRIQLPVAVRRAFYLEPGDRLVLAAPADQDQIVASTTAALGHDDGAAVSRREAGVTTALPAPSELDAARVLLACLGITPDLLVRASAPATMPTFDDYIDRVEQAVSDGTRRAYRSYWQRIRAAWGPCPKAATGSCVTPPVQTADELHRRPCR